MDETAEIGGLSELLSARSGNNDLRVSALPDTTEAGTGGDGENNGNSGNGGDEDAQGIQVSYFIYDHLGNTRVLYHTVLDCDEDEVNYVLEHVVDYYPYGKVLREWQQCDQARYMTTYHERDLESGYDYRGARLYDADIGRFLSVDPLAAEYAGWSSYNYVLGNPVIFIDPTGMAPESSSNWTEDNVWLAEFYGTFGGGESTEGIFGWIHRYLDPNGVEIHYETEKRGIIKLDHNINLSWSQIEEGGVLEYGYEKEGVGHSFIRDPETGEVWEAHFPLDENMQPISMGEAVGNTFGPDPKSIIWYFPQGVDEQSEFWHYQQKQRSDIALVGTWVWDKEAAKSYLRQSVGTIFNYRVTLIIVNILLYMR